MTEDLDGANVERVSVGEAADSSMETEDVNTPAYSTDGKQIRRVPKSGRWWKSVRKER